MGSSPPRPPLCPPPLAQMGARRVALERERQKAFAWWKKMLDDADGNVTRAAETEFPDLPKVKARDRGNYLTRKLGLRDYAAALRERATGRRGAGRPRRAAV